MTMPWTEITRPQYRRAELRYASDLTDAEWALIVPFMPEQRHLGRRRSTDLRAVVEALFYIASTGCQWRQLPKDFPPYSTVQGYFYKWVRQGRWEIINHALVMASREKAGREASPTAGVIDSQSVKTTESGGPSYDAGKKIKGRKRHVVTDTAGHLVGVVVHIASIQDRDGAVAVLASIRKLYHKRPFGALLPAMGLNVLGRSGAEGFRTTLWIALTTTRRVSVIGGSRF